VLARASAIAGKRLSVFCKGDDIEKLPTEVRDRAWVTPLDVISEEEAYKTIKYCIVTPGIIDYRMGTIPYEIFKAIKCGSQPIVPIHQILRPVSTVIKLMVSLKELDDMVESILEGEDPVITLTENPIMLQTSDKFVSKVLTAFERGRSAAK